MLLLDRARFPRDKPCGGGVTLRAAQLLPFTLDPVVEDVVSRVELRLRYGRRFERGDGHPLVLMTQRRVLDAYLARQAVDAGAVFRDGTRAERLAIHADGVTVVAGGERLHARTLVGADGANGICARALELGGNQAVGVAIEGNTSYAALRTEANRGRMVLEFGVTPGGYGWVFPKGDHVNVGIGAWEREGPRIREHLKRLCAAHGIDPTSLDEVRGHRLPLRSPSSTLARGPALLVGDAAGLVDPVSGDGMYEGFLSGKLAAEAVLDVVAGRERTLDPYSARLTRRLTTHLWTSWSAKAALDRFPRATFLLARTQLVWNVVEKVVRGDLADVTTVRGPARPPLKAIAALARAAGNPGQAFREA